MKQVALLTLEQKNQLVGKLYTNDSYFNPIQDADDNWVIGTQEIKQYSGTELNWIKDLTLIEYQPKPFNNPLKKK